MPCLWHGKWKIFFSDPIILRSEAKKYSTARVQVQPFRYYFCTLLYDWLIGTGTGLLSPSKQPTTNVSTGHRHGTLKL